LPKDPRGKVEKEGPLAGHYKRGKTFTPPLLTYEQMVPSEWARDDLPDLLWPLVLATLEKREAAALFRKAQEALLKAIPATSLEASGAALDGRLTSLERFPEGERAQVIQVLNDFPDRSRLIPPELIGVLKIYSSRWRHLSPSIYASMSRDRASRAASCQARMARLVRLWQQRSMIHKSSFIERPVLD
jgi:hypothetical protein